jgi:GT2 family glycosyltransferase
MNDIKEYEVAIIIPCKNEGIYIKQTLDFLLQTEARSVSEILVIDDGSNDNCCEFLKKKSKYYSNVSLIETKGIGAAKARNLGASIIKDANILVFCDAHIIMKQNWLKELLTAFQSSEVSAVCPGIGHFDPNKPVGYGQTWNENLEVYWLKKPKELEEIPLGPGGCIAIRKTVFDSVGGFNKDFVSWGFEDVELSLRLWLMGYKIFVHPGVKIGHKFRKVQPYEVDLTEFYYNKLLMGFSNFNSNRWDKLLSIMEQQSNYHKILERVLKNDICKKREDYLKQRIHDDNWFFNKFIIPF